MGRRKRNYGLSISKIEFCFYNVKISIPNEKICKRLGIYKFLDYFKASFIIIKKEVKL